VNHKEHRFLYAQARWTLAERAYSQMSGAYNTAVAQEYRAAGAAVQEAAEAMMQHDHQVVS